MSGRTRHAEEMTRARELRAMRSGDFLPVLDAKLRDLRQFHHLTWLRSQQYKHLALASRNVAAVRFVATHGIDLTADDVIHVVNTTPAIIDHWVSLNLPVRRDIVRLCMRRNDPDVGQPLARFLESWRYLADRMGFPTDEAGYTAFCAAHTMID